MTRLNPPPEGTGLRQLLIALGLVLVLLLLLGWYRSLPSADTQVKPLMTVPRGTPHYDKAPVPRPPTQ